MTKALKKISLLILCIVCFIPYLLVLTGHAQIIKGSGSSTMGVIIGPVIIPEDGLIGGGSGWSPDYSSSNLSPNTPYADGALRGYSTIGVYNVVRDTKSWNGFKYASYIRYFRISRTDGRLIYDDDGILDVSTSKTSLTDEIVNYPSYIYSVETKLPIKSGAGFLWTDQQAKFKSGGELSVTFYFADSSNGSEAHIYDMPTKPSDKTNKLSTIMYENSTGGPAKTYDCFAVSINATGQYENTFWGNTGGDVSVSANLTNYIAISERDWSNELTTNDYVGKGTYKGCTTYYSPKDFTVIARNLNNLLKVNDVEVTSQYGTSVVPYKDGHHISISEEGLTKVQIENGAEGRYTTYYCFIDETLPDVNYTFHNANALEKRVVGNIITNSNGSKSQTIYEGIFKDQVQINFGYDENTESPEIATCTFNGNTFEIQNGQWFNEEGEYTITVTDLAGNTTISKFTIDKNAPSYNLNRLQSDKTYKISKWYLTTIPYGYTSYGTYSFKEQADALSFACEVEKQNNVTKYYLNDVDDFIDTHLVASGNAIKAGDYWYYKSRENPDLYVYYFDKNSLEEVIEYYAQDFVSDEQIYRLNSSIYPNNYGNSLDDSMYDNIIEKNGIKAYIVNNFTFKYVDDVEASKIYYDYAEDDKENWIEFQFDKSFASQVNAGGLYKIKEVDFVGNETTYYVFYDNQAPMLDIQVKVYGNDKNFTQTISVNDIPNNGELVLYYEDFDILNIIEDDKWYVLEVRCPVGTTKTYTYLDNLPAFSSIGAGEYTITIADRLEKHGKVYMSSRDGDIRLDISKEGEITVTTERQKIMQEEKEQEKSLNAIIKSFYHDLHLKRQQEQIEYLEA